MANIVYISNDEHRLNHLKAFVEKNGHTFTIINSTETLVIVDAAAGQGAVAMSDQFDLASWLATNPIEASEPTVTTPEPVAVVLDKEENEECACKDENEEHRLGGPVEAAEACAAENEEKAVEPDHVDIEQDGMVPAFSSVIVKRINDNRPIEAIVDTGADLCSIDASDITINDTSVKFTFAAMTYKVPLVSKASIVATNGTEERAVVKFDIELDGTSYSDVEFTLADRPDGTPMVLIGREFLAKNDLLVQA